MSDDKTKNKIQLEAGLDVTPVKQGAAEIKSEMQAAAASVAQSAQVASKAIDGIGAGGAASAQKVEAATKTITDSIKRVPGAVGEATKSMSDWQKFVGANMASAMKEFGGHGPAMKALGEQWRAMSAEAKQAAAGVAQAASSISQGIAPAVSATAQLSAQQTRLLESIKRQAIGLTDGKAALLEYRAAQAGLGDAAAPYIAKLREAERAQGNLGMSAKQTAAALRTVPAQMQDIVVSLQAGQNPMTVFLQQGSQLSTVFGGAGAALKGVAGYVAGLVTPFTVAAVAGAGLALAAFKGREEFDSLNNTMKSTGAYTGLTTKQVTDMAARLGATSGNVSEATEALRQLIATGRVGGDQLEGLGRVALQMAKATGGGIKEAVSSLSGLTDDAVKWAEKYNQQYHFMTAAQYNLAKQYDETGDKAAAARVVIEALQEAHTRMYGKASEEVGFLQKYYEDWSRGIDKIKQGLLGIGKPDSNFDKINKALAERESLEKQLQSAEKYGDASRMAYLQHQLDGNLALITSLRKVGDAQREQAAKDKKAAEDAAQAAVLGNYLGDTKYADKKTRYALEVERENKAFAEAVKGFDKTSSEYEKALARHKANLAQIAESNKEKSPVNNEVAHIKAKIDAQSEYLDLLKEQGLAAKELTEGEKLARKIQREILEGKIDPKARPEKESALAEAKKLGALERQTRDYEALLESRKKFGELRDKEAAAIGAEIVKINEKAEAIEDEVAMYGLGRQAIDSLAIARLEEKKAVLLQFDGSAERIALLEEEIAARKRLAGAMDAKDARQSAAKAAEEVEREWKRSFDRISDWLGDSLQRGFEDGKGFFKSMIKSIEGTAIRLAVQPFTYPFAAAGASFLNPGIANAAGASNGLAQGASLFSAGKAIWDGFSVGFDGIGTSIATSVQRGLNMLDPTGAADALQFGPVQNSAFATGIGTFGSYLGGIGAGFGLGNFLANGYGSKSTVGVGTVAGAILGGPIGAAIGGMIAGAANRAFGSKVVGSGVLGSISGDEFNGNAYEFKKGGFLRGGSKTVTSALDKAVDDTFSAAIKGMYDNFSALGTTIGAGGDLLKDFSYEFRLALADFDDAGKQKEIQRALSVMSDSMAKNFVDAFRTSIDTAQQAASRYFTNTIDGERSFSGGVVSKTAASSPLDPYIADIIRIFDKQRESLAGVTGSEGKLAAFTQALFGLGDGLVENSGYLRQFGEALDFVKLESVAKEGETVVDTFGRLNTVFAATSSVAEMLGNNVETAFGALGLASTAARERLITLAGGIDSLATGMQFFSQNFLTEAERLAPTQKLVADEMSRLGLAGVTTHEQFKNVVKGLDLSSEAGARMYSDLLKIAPAFDTVADAAKTAAEETRKTAEENAMKAVDSAFGVLRRSVETDRKTITSAYDAAMDSLKVGLDGVNSRISKLTGLSGSLKSTIDRITVSGSVDADRAAAKAQIETAIALARAGGVFPDSASLSRSLDLVSQIDANSFASMTDFKREQILTKNSLQDLAGLTDSQLTIEEQTQKSIEDQIKATEDGFKSQMSYLDGILESAQTQIDALNGIDTSIKSLADAILSFNRASTAAGGGSIGGPVGSAVANTYLDEFGNSAFSLNLPTNEDLVRTWYQAAGEMANATAEGIAYWTKELARTDVSQREVKATFASIVEQLTGKNLPSFDVGTNWVSRDMTAKIHAGERIVPRADNIAMISALQNRGADNAAVVDALQRVEKLLENISAETRATAQHSNGTKKILQRVVPDGDAIATRAEA